MRDRADNCVVVCSIENFDPMGVHTGDSITVAPAQTLSDVEYQRMRDDAFACIRRIGVETGGSNIQFAVNPRNGDTVVIEMNPRVSRSSALASKATGFPIAKIAARLAVGYTLDEITNDITGDTPASFEPTIDYVVMKIPCWAFEKFPGIPDVLGTRMQSVGEAMAIGRTFPESLQKGLRSLERGRLGLNCDPAERLYDGWDDDELVRRCAVATPDRPFHLEAALRRGISVERLHAATGVDPWFLDQFALIIDERAPPGRPGGAGRPRPQRLAAGQAARLRRRPAGLAVVGTGTARERGRRPPGPPRRRGAGHDEDRRHLRSRVRGPHPVPLLDLRGHRRGRPHRPAEDHHPRIGAQPDRPGRRVRLLLRAGQLRPPRRRLRDRHGQLQPRDRLHRLRHQRPALLRAAHMGGRHQRPRRRGRHRHRRRGHRVPRRPDPAQAGRPPPRRADPRHVAGVHRPGRGPRALERPVRQARDPPTGRRHRRHHRGRPRRHGPDRLPRPGPAELRARRAGPWRSSTTTTTCAGPWRSWPGPAPSAGRAACRRSGPC